MLAGPAVDGSRGSQGTGPSGCSPCAQYVPLPRRASLKPSARALDARSRRERPPFFNASSSPLEMFTQHKSRSDVHRQQNQRCDDDDGPKTAQVGHDGPQTPNPKPTIHHNPKTQDVEVSLLLGRRGEDVEAQHGKLEYAVDWLGGPRFGDPSQNSWPHHHVALPWSGLFVGHVVCFIRICRTSACGVGRDPVQSTFQPEP